MSDLCRLASEQTALTDLEVRQPWFTIVKIYLDDQVRLCFDAEIEISQKCYPIRLTYPQTFPYTPVSVVPQSRERWSEHQWGLGELCLEWGPDNWVQGITGAQMVESAHRLLSDETPINDEEPPAVPSRHIESLGQQLRTSALSFVLTRELAAELDRMHGPQMQPMSLIMRSAAHTLLPLTIGDESDTQWRDQSVPEGLKNSSLALKGYIAILPPDMPVPKVRTATGFKTALKEAGCTYPDGYVSGVLDMCLVSAGEVVHLFWIKEESNTVTEAKCIPEGEGGRLEQSRAALGACTVGIVGCGSAGSKIATSLARTGVGNFLLIDDDVMLPENLVRQDLDWEAIGDHKVEGLKRRIELIAPAVKCTVRRHQLASQESSGSVDGALTLLQKCDLIVDATANPRVFNLIGSVVAAAEKPLVWLEVFGGGFGGLIARSRPGIDPSPQVSRARIEAWCAAKNIDTPRATAGYEIEAPGGPLIADDADVSVIAAHATRFVIDILVSAEESSFPVSSYLIGLTGEWLFQQPFQTFPIDLGEPELETDTTIDPDGLSTLKRLISERYERNLTS